MIDFDEELDERKRRDDHDGGSDTVEKAQQDELLPDARKVDEAAEQDKEPEPEARPEDKHVELPAEQIAALAGITPAANANANANAEPAAAPEAAAPQAAAPEAAAPEQAHAPEHEAEEHEGEGLEFGPPAPTEEQKQSAEQPELAGAAAAASHVAVAAVHEEHAQAPAATPAADKKGAPAAHRDADGFAGSGEVKGKQKWNENAFYKKDGTTGFDVSGKRAVTLGKNDQGEVDAADAAVYATAAVETSGTYDAVQTYDKGILSFGIMQWTLHQGSLMKFLEYLKTKCGPDGKAAFDEHFTPLGIDVSGESLLVGGQAIHPDDAGRKALDKLVRADKDTTRRWVTAFHTAGQDDRVARAQWTYTKKQYVETAGKSLDKYTGFARKKGYSPKYPGQYRTPSFWCRDPDAAALFFSMTANNPGYSYYGVIKAADALMDAHGPDPSKWPDGWPHTFTAIYATLLPVIIASWKGRVAKTLENLHAAKDGKTPPPQAHAHAPMPHITAPAAAHAPAAATHAPAPAPVTPEVHHGLGWLADVMARKVVRGLEDAGTAVKHFFGFASTGSPAHAVPQAAPPVAHELAQKIQAAAPAVKPAAAAAGKDAAGKKKPGEMISSAKLHREGGKGKSHYKLDEAQYAFKQKVYEAAVGANIAKGQIMFGGLTDDELTTVEGKKIKHDVAPHLTSMMSALRAAWQHAKASGDEKAARVTEIGLSSGYRDPEHDFSLWDDYYYKYYAATAEAREATGDPHGDAAMRLLVKFIRGKKAPPGFSNHTGGTAVDMHAIVDGQSLGADFANQKRWYDSWVWHWLHENAASHGFKPIPTEAWHWEFHG